MYIDTHHTIDAFVPVLSEVNGRDVRVSVYEVLYVLFSDEDAFPCSD